MEPSSKASKARHGDATLRAHLDALMVSHEVRQKEIPARTLHCPEGHGKRVSRARLSSERSDA